MTTELKLQTLTCEAVRARGGMAFKLANRFLVGVPDLFVQMQGLPTLILEAKLNKHAKAPREVRVELTAPQGLWLWHADNQGACVGTLSFLELGRKTQYCTIVPIGKFARGDTSNAFVASVPFTDYRQMSVGRREEAVISAIAHHAQYWRDPEWLKVTTVLDTLSRPK